jgi:GNAT superfamily N-acetyltransferase
MDELLAEGGLIRKLWIFENNAYRDHLLRLDPASRRNRFGGAVSDDYIRSHTRDLSHTDAVLYGFFVDGTLRGATELRPVGGWKSGEAEAAFSVEQDWQSHGIGSALLQRVLLAARNRGIKHLHFACLARNQRMQQLARKFDAQLRFDFDSVVGEVQAPRPTPMSMVREAASDGYAFVSAMLDAQTRLLKPR